MKTGVDSVLREKNRPEAGCGKDMMDAQTEDTKMLNALDEFLADNADDAAVSAVSCDPSGKARPVYSTGIMSYEDSTALIWDHTERLFDYSQNVDPHSEQYLKICKLLQRAVSHLGRAVITRAAMQQKDRRLLFHCRNTKSGAKHEYGGVGLNNVTKRLELIYGTDYSLDITVGEDTYDVLLNLPERHPEDFDRPAQLLNTKD